MNFLESFYQYLSGETCQLFLDRGDNLARYTLYIFQQDSHVFKFLPPSSLLEEIQEYDPEAHFSRGQTYLGSTSTKRPIGFSSCDEKHNRIFPFSFVFNVNPRPAFFARKGKKKKNEIKVYDSLFFPSLSRKKTNKI